MISKRMIAIAATALMVLAAIMLVKGWSQSPVAYRLEPDNKELVKNGEAVYAQHCASCHGVSLEGQPNWRVRRDDGKLPAPPHDETGHTWHHRDELLFRITKRGTTAVVGDDYQSDMFGFAAILSDEEIHAVLSFIKSTWSNEIQRRHDERNKTSASQQ